MVFWQKQQPGFKVPLEAGLDISTRQRSSEKMLPWNEPAFADKIGKSFRNWHAAQIIHLVEAFG